MYIQSTYNVYTTPRKLGITNDRKELTTYFHKIHPLGIPVGILTIIQILKGIHSHFHPTVRQLRMSHLYRGSTTADIASRPVQSWRENNFALIFLREISREERKLLIIFRFARASHCNN